MISLRVKAVLLLVALCAVAGALWWPRAAEPPPGSLAPRPLHAGATAITPPGTPESEPAAALFTGPATITRAASRPLTLVVRAVPNTPPAAAMPAVAALWRSAGVEQVWLQFKQDETDEFIGGTAFYPSAVAPVAAGWQDDRIATFIAALNAAGIRVAAWVPCLHDPVACDAHHDWRAWSADDEGNPELRPGWLCPRAPGALQYEGAIVGEIAARYPSLTAIYTDFIRYDSDWSCVCPRCLDALDNAARWTTAHGARVTAADVRDAGRRRTPLWKTWSSLRSQNICAVIDALRDAVAAVRPHVWMGACVLPFSAGEYRDNTVAGQDLRAMARHGVDEIAVMGYWDDWDKSPAWLGDGLVTAKDQTGGEARLTCLLDGDMSIRRTRLTLDAVGAFTGPVGFFHYGTWNAAELTRVTRAVDLRATAGPLPRPAGIDVVVRVDTEPDAQKRYSTVNPGMVQALCDLFAAEGIHATFVTCGRLAELQPETVRIAVRHGHEVAVHAYDHEQMDDQSDAAQIEIIDRALDVFDGLGVAVYGFGAPRNSMSAEAYDHLIDRGFEYDSSAAYDPLTGLRDVALINHTRDAARTIAFLPYVVPNDFDARHELELTAPAMVTAWKDRLARVTAGGEPCFVLDLHQWLVTQPDNMAALKAFIDHAKAQPGVRFVTLREAAQHARVVINAAESGTPATTPDR